MPRPTVSSGPSTRSRSIPVADCSAPSGLNPPPPLLSVLSDEASWTACSGDKLVIESPNRMRETISSCGRPGTLEKAICGLLARPDTATLTVTVSIVSLASKRIAGS